jgi:hypothetical protein
VSPNDRLYDELLAPVVEDYTTTAELLAAVPRGDRFHPRRAYLEGQIEVLERTGDRIADVLEVDRPEWKHPRTTVAS